MIRRLSLPTVLLLVALTLLLNTGGIGGQGAAPQPSPSAASQDSVALVFERELFLYPGYERRNPFRPLTGDDDLGPRFEDLALMGVMLAGTPTGSIALIGARPPGAASSAAPTRSFRLRVGESVGPNRVLEIRLTEVLLEVEEFGVRDLRVLELRRSLIDEVPEPTATPQIAPEGGQPPSSGAPNGGANGNGNDNGDLQILTPVQGFLPRGEDGVGEGDVQVMRRESEPHGNGGWS